MSRDDRERWDSRYADGTFPEDYPDWLDQVVGPLLPERGRALDVAAGRGRVSLFALLRGWETTALDVSPRGLEIAARVAKARAPSARFHPLVHDLEAPLPTLGPFDLVTIFHYRQEALWLELPRLLAPGGLLVAETATRTNLERNPRPSARFLMKPGELGRWAREIAGLEIVRDVEGWFAGRHLARVIARRD